MSLMLLYLAWLTRLLLTRLLFDLNLIFCVRDLIHAR